MTAPTIAAAGGYLTTAEVGARLGGLSEQTIRKFVHAEGLPAHRVNRRLYFDPAEVDAWIRNRNGQAARADHRAVIRALVDAAPELTDEQVAKIRAVLSNGAA